MGERHVLDTPAPVTMALKITHQNPGHTRGRLFVGRTPGARGMSGEVVFRTDELAELEASGVIEVLGVVTDA